MGRKISKEEFIEQAKKVHGDKFDYSKIEYKGSHEKVCIVCPEHGVFWQGPNSHLRGIGCPKCGRTKKLTTDEFIEKARKIHGNKYDYSKVEYINNYTKVCIICPEHGEFWQTPKDHLNGKGCIKCSNNVKYTKENFIKKAKQIYGDKYDYSKVDYINAHTKVCIICPEHGEFWQTPDNHYRWGCKNCRESSLEKETEKFLNENNIKYTKQQKFKWLVYKQQMSLDFYLPDYNVAIECQGDQHFTPFRYKTEDIKFELRQDRDLVKYTLCNKHGIKIFYYTDNLNYNVYLSEPIYHNLIKLLNNIKNDN